MPQTFTPEPADEPADPRVVKVALFPVLLFAGCLISGLYGALHDQISYTVSPDYFHALKFRQFDIPPDLHNRLGAALVGWYATWWMGLFIGIPLLSVGLIMPDARTYLTRCLVAFAVVAVTALAVGLWGLAYACLTTMGRPPDFPWSDQVDWAKQKAFARVAVMHEFSYLGGFLGILTASAYLVVARVRLHRPPRRGLAARIGADITGTAGGSG